MHDENADAQDRHNEIHWRNPMHQKDAYAVATVSRSPRWNPVQRENQLGKWRTATAAAALPWLRQLYEGAARWDYLSSQFDFTACGQ